MLTKQISTKYHVGKKRMYSKGLTWARPFFNKIDVLLNKAYHFNLGPCYSDISKTVTTNVDPKFRLPFPVTLLSTESDEKSDGYIMLLMEDDEFTKAFDMVFPPHELAFGFVAIPFVSVRTSSDLLVLPFGFAHRVPSIDHVDMDKYEDEHFPVELVCPKLVQWFDSMDVPQVTYNAVSSAVTRYFSRLLYCKNIEVRDKKEPSVSRLLKKKDEAKIVTKDIVVKVPGKGIIYKERTVKEIPFREMKSLGVTGQKRGHFKTYTEERPLFGKYVGTWWWAPIFGTSHRNYSVDIDQEAVKERGGL